MVMKCASVCLVALALLGSFCDAQWKPSFPQRPAPKHELPKQKPQDLQQSKQTFEKPLTWTYPLDPKPDVPVEVTVELRYPVPAATVSVECRERDVLVEVQKDLFGIGQYISPSDLTLGNCPAIADDNNAQVVLFQSELHQCGSTLTMTDTSLIYTFVLNYKPGPLGGLPVVRTSSAVVIVECYYQRHHNVSSLPLEPLWIPFSAVKVSEEFLYFTLRLMTDDWQFDRPIYQYFLGDTIYIEASVKQYHHVPLRVYLDSCVATLSPDRTSSPSYAFIDNHGCLVDPRITGSVSRFWPRTAENVLRFTLEAFRFREANSGLLYITCHLKATSCNYAIDSEHRACSYISGWKEVSGADPVCGSCESGLPPPSGKTVTGSSSTWGTGQTGPSNPGRKSRAVSETQPMIEWEGEVTLGPIPIGEKVVA